MSKKTFYAIVIFLLIAMTAFDVVAHHSAFKSSYRYILRVLLFFGCMLGIKIIAIALKEYNNTKEPKYKNGGVLNK